MDIDDYEGRRPSLRLITSAVALISDNDKQCILHCQLGYVWTYYITVACSAFQPIVYINPTSDHITHFS